MIDSVLTHHWLIRRRGGEKVLAALRELLPAAPLYTLLCDPDGFSAAEWRELLPRGAGDPRTAVHTSWLQRIPGARRRYPNLLPLMPAAARSMKLPAAKLVVCSDAAIAKAMRVDPRSRLVCYCHSPMRYVWDLRDEYRRTLPAPLRPLWNPLTDSLRRADRRAAQRVDQFVANSQCVVERIRRAYGRDSVVVHPPVDLPPAPPPAGSREDFFLCVGHHVPYKRLDLAVDACRRLKRRLVVIGDGPDVARLRGGADERIAFLGYQPDAVVYEHYRRAAGLIFAGEEDFGIVPVEAIAQGCPVIAYAAGGARETVRDGVSGVWFEAQTVDALCAAIERCESVRFDAGTMRADAERFSRARFLAEMRGVLAN